MVASNRTNCVKCCKLLFLVWSPKMALTEDWVTVVHTRTPERLFKNPFVNFSWLLNQFHYEGSIKTNTTKCNSFFNNGSISFVAKEISSLYRSRSMTSKNIKQTPRINDLEKKKKGVGGRRNPLLHISRHRVYCCVFSYLFYSKSDAHFCTIGTSFL